MIELLHITDPENYPKRKGNFEVQPVKMLLDGVEAYGLSPEILKDENYSFVDFTKYKIKKFEPLKINENFLE